MIQPRPWGRSQFIHHNLFTAKFPEGKSHYTTLIVLKISEIRSLQLCYRIKEPKLLHEFLVPSLWQTYWCPLSIFLCSARTQRTGCPPAGNTLAQFLTRHLLWSVLWHKCSCLCQLFKDCVMSLRDSSRLLSLIRTFWNIFLNFCDHSCYQ